MEARAISTTNEGKTARPVGRINPQLVFLTHILGEPEEIPKILPWIFLPLIKEASILKGMARINQMFLRMPDLITVQPCPESSALQFFHRINPPHALGHL